MKKYLLSLFTIFGFAFYAVFASRNNTGNLFEDLNTDSLVPSAPENHVRLYNDGIYLGKRADAYYGYMEVQAIIKDGLLVDVVFMDFPQDRENSIKINSYAMPILKSEAIKSQNAEVATVSGATDSSMAFRESLAEALEKAKK